MIEVFFIDRYDGTNDQIVRSAHKWPLKSIREMRVKELEGSGEMVPVASLDHYGRYDPRQSAS